MLRLKIRYYRLYERARSRQAQGRQVGQEAHEGATNRPPLKPAAPGQPVLLSGGNPQIAKGYGHEPVKAYIAAMLGWKSKIRRNIDVIIEWTVPDVLKAMKWNSPMYGVVENRHLLSLTASS